MPRDLNSLTAEELGRLFPIILSKSKDEWKQRFLEEKKRITEILGREKALRIEHIGSTAVPGLLAKPTIDILVEIPKDGKAHDDIKALMVSSGYIFMTDHTSHLMFVKGYTPEGFKGQCYHIHMGSEDREDLWERLCFRNYLKSNPDVSAEYAALKVELARKFQHDRDGYTDAKTAFIRRVTDAARSAVHKSRL